jgi:hypothetical protein
MLLFRCGDTVSSLEKLNEMLVEVIYAGQLKLTRITGGCLLEKCAKLLSVFLPNS